MFPCVHLRVCVCVSVCFCMCLLSVGVCEPPFIIEHPACRALKNGLVSVDHKLSSSDRTHQAPRPINV